MLSHRARPPAAVLPRSTHRADAGRALASVARILGLEVTTQRHVDRAEGALEVGDAYVRVQIEPLEIDGPAHPGGQARPKVDVRITVEPEDLSRKLFVASRASRTARRSSGIGDPSFDAAFYCVGRDPDFVAALDRATRSSLLRLRGRIQIAAGRVTHHAPGLFGDPAALAARVLAVTEIAQALVVIPTVEVLAARATQDPEPRVREMALRHLTRDAPDQAVTTATCRRALADPDASVRARAAIHLGPEGFDVAEAIARDLTAPIAVRRRALHVLAAGLPFERAHALFRALLQGRRFRSEAAEALGKWEDPRAIPTLVEALPLKEATEALGRFDRPEAEAALIPLLHHAFRGVQRCAAWSLAQIGRRRSVIALRQVLRDPTPLDPLTRKSFRVALKAARERLRESPGGLAVVSPAHPGDLSLDPEGNGAVSRLRHEET